MNKKKIIFPLIIIAVLLAMLAAVSMLEDKDSDTGDVPSNEAEQYTVVGNIFELDIDTIDEISMHTEENDFTFAKNYGMWSYVENPNVSVSSGSVDILASLISNIGYTEFFDKDTMTKEDCSINDKSDYISFKSELGDVVLRRGINTADGNLSYVASDDSDRIYLIERETAEKLFAPLKSYRNSAMINLDFENIISIEIKNKEHIIINNVGADTKNAVYNNWQIASPMQIGANDEVITSKIIDALKQIKINDFASDSGDFAAFGLGSKDKFVRLTDNSKRSKTLYFSDKQNGKYYISVENEPTIYEIALANAPYAELRFIELADRNINLAKMTDIKNVTISGNGWDYNIEFASDHGKINGKKIPYDTLNNTIFPSVCGLMADDIYQGDKTNTEVYMTYNYKSGKSDSLEFSSYNDRYYSVAKNGSTKYLILKSKLSDLVKILERS